MTVEQVENKYKGVYIVLGKELNEYEENNKFVDDLYYITTDDGVVVKWAFNSIDDIYKWLKVVM